MKTIASNPLKLKVENGKIIAIVLVFPNSKYAN